MGFPDRVSSNTNLKWPVIVTFSNSTREVCTENIWCVLRVKSRFQIPPAYGGLGLRAETCLVPSRPRDSHHCARAPHSLPAPAFLLTVSQSRSYTRTAWGKGRGRNYKIARNCFHKWHTFCCRLISKLADFVCSFLRAAFITAISESLDFRTRVISIFALRKKKQQTRKTLVRGAATSPDKRKTALTKCCTSWYVFEPAVHKKHITIFSFVTWKSWRRT